MQNDKNSNSPWVELSKEEQAMMTIYKRKLLGDLDPKLMRELINSATKVYEKYPDFSVADVP